MANGKPGRASISELERLRNHADYLKRRAWYQARYQRNKERIRRAAAAYREAHREELAVRGREYRKTAQSIWWRARIRAKRHGREFSLSVEWLQARLDAGVCEVTGLPFSARGVQAPTMPSIDRIDSTKGYTEDNCRVICWALNAAFNQWGETAVRPIFEAYLRRAASSV